jgi:hypothetical protein
MISNPIKINCFVINIKNRQRKLLSSIKEAASLELTGTVENLDMFRYKLLPKDFNPDIVIVDFKTFNANHGHFHLLWKKCRRIMITGVGKSEDSYPFDAAFDEELEIVEEATSYEDLQTLAACRREEMELDEKWGWHSYEEGELKFEMRNRRRVQMNLKDILEIRQANEFTYVSIDDSTYISPYPITQLNIFAKKDWMAKVSKNTVVNLKKIKITNRERGEVTMNNGVVIYIEPWFRKAFWEKLAITKKIREGIRQLSPCVGFEVFHINRYYPH